MSVLAISLQTFHLHLITVSTLNTNDGQTSIQYIISAAKRAYIPSQHNLPALFLMVESAPYKSLMMDDSTGTRVPCL